MPAEWQAAIASGTPVAEFESLASAALDLRRLPGRFPYLLVTPQHQTERVLEERATRAGADIRYGCEVTGPPPAPRRGGGQRPPGGEPGPGDARRLDGGCRRDAQHGPPRPRVAISWGKPVVRSVMPAKVRLTQPPPDALTVNSTGDAFALISPFGDGWYRVIAWQRRDQPPEGHPGQSGQGARGHPRGHRQRLRHVRPAVDIPVPQ